jgi:hypothetical protein
MSAFKPQQRYLTLGGRAFHFVAYEGRAENLARNQPAEPPMWFLMVEGRRCPVTTFHDEQSADQLDGMLTLWLQENVLGETAQ